MLPVDFAAGGNTKMTIGELAESAFKTETYHQDLRRHGLAVREFDGKRYLLVARRHRGLSEIFAGTDWEGGAWPQLLARLSTPGGARAETPRINISFAGAKGRAVWIPFELISDQGNDDIE